MMNAVADPRQPYWHPGWTDPDPHYRAIRREHTKRSLQLAHELGAPHITTEPGGHLTPEQTWDDGAQIFYDELMPCVELAEKLEVKLLIEPEPDLLIETFGQYLQFIAADRFALGETEFRHRPCLLRERRSARLGRTNGNRTRVHYHFEDIAATRVHQHLIPGHGAIDFAATLLEIRETGYDGWITVELYPYIDNPDAAARSAGVFEQYRGEEFDFTWLKWNRGDAETQRGLAANGRK